MVSPLSFLLAAPMLKTTSRDFQFVGYGSSFSSDDGRPTISCDGRIPPATLEVTHWTGNETPDKLYKDTSTEMALKLASDQEYSDLTANAWVLNNHFDTDGVLSVWACLEPELALEHAELLRQGAEAGDFGEWSSDLGVKLDSALLELCSQSTDEETAFYKAFEELPSLLKDLKETGGKAYEKLWKPGFEDALNSWDVLQNDGSTSLEAFNDELAILKKPSSLPSVAPVALHRGLVEKGLDTSVKRVLRVATSETNDNLNSYQYEKAGHGWVTKLVQRPMVPAVDSQKLVEKLNESGITWKSGGSSLVSICQTAEPTKESLEDVISALVKYDEGLSSN